MTETAWTTLRQLLADRYDELCRQLSRRLNSEDLAHETLHDTWLHLVQKEGSATIQNPASYLLRTALNLAIDRQRRTPRLARQEDADAFLDVPDQSPGPVQIIESQEDMGILRQALVELTPRQRFILLASRLEARPLREIADELGLSQRMVDIELRRALRHCAIRLRMRRR